MPLIQKESQISSYRAPWRGALAGILGAFAFIVGLALVARATSDSAGIVPSDAVPDAPGAPDAGGLALDGGSPAGGLLDAGAPDGGGLDGVLDAGALDASGADAAGLVGPEREPAAVPAVVEGPPIVAADVVAVVVPLVEECLRKAIRFDPALGGRVLMRIVVGGGRLVPSLPVSPSPVLSSCIATGGSALAWPTAPGEHHLVVARLALDGLRRAVRVESAELMAVAE